MENELQSLKALLKQAQNEPEDSDFFKHRGSKAEYVKTLDTKIARLTHNENVTPSFKQFCEQKCWDGFEPDPSQKTKYSPTKGKSKRVNNCVKANEGVVGRARPTADRMRLSDDFKQRLLNHGMNMYQQHGAQYNDIITTLGKITRMNDDFSDAAKQAVFNYLGGDFAKDLEAKLDAYDEEMYSEKNAKCTGPTKKASSTSKGKKWMKCVKSDSGGYKRIHWGQKGVKVSGKANTKRRKSFRARHKCSTAKANTPRGQACKDW